MEVANFKISIKEQFKFPASDEGFVALFNDALKAKKSTLAFDLDFKYKGLEGPAQGFHVTRDNVIKGGYAFEASGPLLFGLNIDGLIDANLIFFSKNQLESFKAAVDSKAIEISIKSIGNDGGSRKTFWSMGCNPPLALNCEKIEIT